MVGVFESLARAIDELKIEPEAEAIAEVLLDYGGATRTLPAPLWNALVVRDEGCRVPGCDRPSAWCDGHHVRWVEHGGPTRLGNLVLACRKHHTLLHTPGWRAHLDDDGTFTVSDPRGRVRTTSPPDRKSVV
jgi:hypothetical protein